MGNKIKKTKKVKVEYDIEGKMKKNKEKRISKFSKYNVIALIIFFIIEGLFYYLTTPVISFYKSDFYIWLIISICGFNLCMCDLNNTDNIIIGNTKGKYKKLKCSIYLTVILIAVLIIGGILSSPIFRASKYSSLIEIKEGNFEQDIVRSENINDIALMDTDSAKIIGDRAIGSLSEVVSQYEVSDDYSTIDYNGKPMKVAPLEYAGFIKFMNNRKEGIPGYVLVDPVKNEAKYVKLEKTINYSPSASFNYNLKRHVQMKYPFYEFNGFYFELDNEGNPFYICPVLKPNAGLFGAKDIKGIVICDPCSGDCEYKEVADVPNWVDRVYDGDLACKKYDWYGNLSGGFINSVIGNKGCKVTTDDYGYKVIDGDLWVYTGVTSVNGDESNIGFVLMNLRTAESKYFAIAGAEEYSAMSSAEGQVQNLGYRASFPSLINIKGVPTYIMVLKDNAGLVKMYALVNVEKYNIVATGTTQKDALNVYKKLLVENDIIGGKDSAENFDSENYLQEKIKISDIKYIVSEGETYVYITDSKNNVYKQKFSDNEEIILLKNGDNITVYYEKTDSKILNIINFE
ncbi:MAG: hypothetical protein PUG10_03205 [Lachnospiraceae bacterium]|nr:hypothetical protein [Lachnospiraceae bacterium]